MHLSIFNVSELAWVLERINKFDKQVIQDAHKGVHQTLPEDLLAASKMRKKTPRTLNDRRNWILYGKTTTN